MDAIPRRRRPGCEPSRAVAPTRKVTRSLGTVLWLYFFPACASRHLTPTNVASVQLGHCPACRSRDRRRRSSCPWAADRMAVLLFVAARGSVAVAAEAVPNTAAGRGAAVFQAVPAASEDQSGDRIPPRTSSGKIWQCLGNGKGVCGISIVELTKYHRTSLKTNRSSNTT